MRNKDEKKAFLKGFLTASLITAAIVGCQYWVINNVPYTYRTSGFKVLIGYITGHTDWYDF